MEQRMCQVCKRPIQPRYRTPAEYGAIKTCGRYTCRAALTKWSKRRAWCRHMGLAEPPPPWSDKEDLEPMAEPTPEEIKKQCDEMRAAWPEHRWRDYESPAWRAPCAKSFPPGSGGVRE